MIYPFVTVTLAAILVMFVPATRTELRNMYESPLVALTFREFNPPNDSIPDDVPIPGLYRGLRVQRRFVPAGEGKLAQVRTGPLAWIWADLDPDVYPLRSMADGRILCGV